MSDAGITLRASRQAANKPRPTISLRFKTDEQMALVKMVAKLHGRSVNNWLARVAIVVAKKQLEKRALRDAGVNSEALSSE